MRLHAFGIRVRVGTLGVAFALGFRRIRFLMQRQRRREEFDAVDTLGGIEPLRARRDEERHAQHVCGHDGKQCGLADAEDLDVVGEPSEQEPDALGDVGGAAEEPVDEHGIGAAVTRSLGALHHHDERDERKGHIRQPREEAQADFLHEGEQEQARYDDRVDSAKDGAKPESDGRGEPEH